MFITSYIYSVENWMGTLSSSPCQLGLGEWLSFLRLSHYKYKVEKILNKKKFREKDRYLV